MSDVETTKDRWPFADPRVEGVREHLERARFFCGLADAEQDSTHAFRFRMAAIYSARAIVEIMLEAAKKQQVVGFKTGNEKQDYDMFEDAINKKLPYYLLIEKIRIHDFHRFGATPPAPDRVTTFIGGPIKLTGRQGVAEVQFGRQGWQETITGQSHVKKERELASSDGKFYDEDSGKWVLLREVLAAYLEAIPPVIADFEHRAG